MKAAIPATMKAVARTKDGKKSPFLADVPVPKPVPGHVLLRVLASPINPSDDYFCKGHFGDVKDEPHVCGFEGAGEVVAVGEGVPHELIGQKVAAWIDLMEHGQTVGMWSEYALVQHKSCVILGPTGDCERFCGLFVNPLTVLGMVRLAKAAGMTALVNTACMSALGKSLIKVAALNGLGVIGVIRKKADIPKLLELGAKAALDLTDPAFPAQVRDACKKFGTKICFDAIGGNVTKQLLQGMPDDSVIHVYGGLSGESALVPGSEKVKVQWYSFMTDKTMTDPEERRKAVEFLREDVKNGGKFFGITVVRKAGLAEFEDALGNYGKTATVGKTIFVPSGVHK